VAPPDAPDSLGGLAGELPPAPTDRFGSGKPTVVYPAEMPTPAAGSSVLRYAYSSDNPGKVTFLRAGDEQPLLGTILSYSNFNVLTDERVLFVFPDDPTAPVLHPGDRIRVTGYSRKIPRVFRFTRIPAGHYDFGFHVWMQAPHRFLWSSNYHDIDSYAIRSVDILDIDEQGYTIKLPASLPSGEYAVMVGLGPLYASTPVLFGFTVK
jgi:hypothetical protein